MAALSWPAPGGLDVSSAGLQAGVTLAALPLGARLILRCRRDWRMAAVALIAPEGIMLAVCSPTGHTYRVRRPTDAPLTFDGYVPVLGAAGTNGWRAALARYDARW